MGSAICSLVTTAVLGTMFAGAARATTIGPDASGFTATDATAFAFEEISGSGTRVLANTDDTFVSIPIGFTFNFYGTGYTSLFASSNGLITFGAGNISFANDNLTTAAAPTQAPPNDLPLIAPLWDDWHTGGVGADAVYYQTLGSAPSRRLVIEWHITAGCCAASPPVADFITFEAILYEGSGNILVQYLDTTTTNSYNHGATATVGIRDVNGQNTGRNLQWSLNSNVINDSTTVLFAPSCGNGAVDGGEQCDEGVDNGTATSCCTAGCQFRAGGETCRVAAGVCDVTETCTGSGGTCPADTKSTAVCRTAADACDVAEVCDGSNDDCPSDAIASSGTECRAVAGTCDVAETCDGVAITCPADAFVAGGTECRAVADVCDVAEQCTGSGPACPADAFEPATTVCRASSIGEVCDIPENCTGTGASCPADAVEPNTTECRGVAGVCDIAENCDGTNKTCPADAVEPSSTVCRATSVGETCDVAENCDGTNVACPADAVLPNGTTCRASGGDCDPAEACDGSAKTCPSDAKSTAVCRAAGGACDVAEVCDGVSDSCPSDVLVPDGNSCEDGLFCNGTQTCTGGVCGGGTPPCSMGESCDEVSNLCFTGNCPATAASCLIAQKNKVLIKNKADNTKDKLIWKWTKGAGTTLADFSDPTTSANYALCFYAGTTAALIQQAAVPASGTKWAPIGTKGFKYKDAGGTADGITKIIVKSGAGGKSKALVKGKGANLPDFDSDLPIAAGDLPLVVQLRNNATGVCFQGSFATPKKNQADQFNAKQP